MDIFYVLVLVSVLENGQEVVSPVDKFAEAAHCIEARDFFRELNSKMDWDEIGIPQPDVQCRDRYDKKVTGEI